MWGGPSRGHPGQGGCLRSLTKSLLSQGKSKDCPLCQQSFKTHHWLMVHMGVHQDEKYPCTKCGKVLANKKMWKRCTSDCVQGKKVACPDCGKQYASSQGMKQHWKTKHGTGAPEMDENFVCSYCRKVYRIKKTWVEHSCNRRVMQR